MANFLQNFFGQMGNMQIAKEQLAKQAQEAAASKADIEYKNALARQSAAQASMQEYERTIAPERFASELAINEANVGQIVANTKRLDTDEAVARYNFNSGQAIAIANQYKAEVRNKTPEQQAAITAQYQAAIDPVVASYGGPRIVLSPSDIKQPLTLDGIKALVPAISSIVRGAKSPNKDIRDSLMGQVIGAGMSVNTTTTNPNNTASVENAVKEALDSMNYESNPGIIKMIVSQMGVENELYQDEAYNKAFEELINLRKTSTLPFKGPVAKDFVNKLADTYFLKTKQKLPSGTVNAWASILTSDTPESLTAAQKKAELSFENRKLDTQVKENAKDRAQQMKIVNIQEAGQNRRASMQARASAMSVRDQIALQKFQNSQNQAPDVAFTNVGKFAATGNSAGVEGWLNAATRALTVGMNPKNPQDRGILASLSDVNSKIVNSYSTRRESISDDPTDAGKKVTIISGVTASKQRTEYLGSLLNAGANYAEIQAIDGHYQRGMRAIGYRGKFDPLPLAVKRAWKQINPGKNIPKL